MSESTPNGSGSPAQGRASRPSSDGRKSCGSPWTPSPHAATTTHPCRRSPTGPAVTQAGVLHYFRSKAQLLTSVLDLRDATDIEQLGPDRPQGLAFLRHLVDTVRRNTEREGIVRLYAVLSAESVTEGHPAQDFFRDRYAGLRTMVSEALAEASELGETRPGLDVEEAATAIVAVMDGLQIQWLLAPGSVDMAASTDRVITALLADLSDLPT